MSSLGRAYSKADFVSFYGGTAEWDRSPVYHPPAPSEHQKSAVEAKAEALARAGPRQRCKVHGRHQASRSYAEAQGGHVGTSLTPPSADVMSQGAT